MISWKTKRVPLYLGHFEAFRMAHKLDGPIMEYGSRDFSMLDARA